MNVTTNHDLSELNVTLDGPENATLTLADGDFEETGTDPYSYTATYDGATDGEYTATLESAASAGDATSGNTDTATVDDRVPTVESVNLTDATDGNGTVSPGDEVTVNATVSGSVDSVTADLAAFDAGTVELVAESGTYTNTTTVGANVTEGAHAATVTATGADGTDSATTETLDVVVDELTVTIGDDRTVGVNETVEYNASVAGATGDVTYDWTFGDGDTATGENVTHTYTDAGTYTVEVTATDDAGTASDAANVTVEDAPVVESANLTDATNANGIVAPGDDVTVSATVSGDVASVEADLSAFDAGNVTLTTNDTGDYAANVTVGSNATDGDQNVTVVATGSQGNTDTGETGALTVDTENLSVSLNDTKTVEEGESAKFSPASVSDATGSVDYDWTFGDGGSASGKTVSYAFDDDGTHEVILTADDGSGDTDTASMSVTVTANETTIEGTTSRPTTTSEPTTTTSEPMTTTTTEPTTTSEPTTTTTTEPTTTADPTTSDSTTSDGDLDDPLGADGDDGVPVETTTAGPATTSDPVDTTTERPTESTTATETTAPTAERTPTANTAEPGAENVPPQSPGEAPGFGTAAALLALLAAAALALRE